MEINDETRMIWMLNWKIRTLRRNPTPINLERIKMYQKLKEPYKEGYNEIQKKYKEGRKQNGLNPTKNSMQVS